MTKQTMVVLRGRVGWKGILYWSVCILLLGDLEWEFIWFSSWKKKHLLKLSDRRSTSLHGYTHLQTKGQFCAACGDVLDPMYLIPVTLDRGVGDMDNYSFAVNLQGEGLSTVFSAGRFCVLVCDRISLHPHWAEASPLVNMWGMIQRITGEMSFSTVVLLLLPLLCWVSCLQNKVPKSTITKWFFFYWNLGIWELFCHTVMLLF